MTTSEQTLPDLLPVKVPRQENKVYTYISADYGKKDIRLVEGNINVPPAYIQGFYELDDKFEEDPDLQLKVVKLASKERAPQKDGKIKIEERIRTIEMPNGLLRVHAQKDYVLHRFLWCHPRNLDGPYYDNTKPWMFRLLQPVEDNAPKRPTMSTLEYKKLALRSVDNMPINEMRTLAAALYESYPDLIDNPAKLKTNELKYNLSVFADANPEIFLRSSPDLATRLRFAIDTLKASDALVFHEAKREWKLSNKKVMGVAVGKNAEDALLLYLVPEANEKDYAKRVDVRASVLRAANFEVEDELEEELEEEDEDLEEDLEEGTDSQADDDQV